MNLQSAETATRRGAKAGGVVAVITFIVVSLAILIDGRGRLETWNDPWNYLDVILVIIFSFGVLRHSRTAAIVLFVYYLAAQIMIAMEKGSPLGLAASIIFLYFFGRAIWGTFSYHKIRKETDPEYRPVRRVMYFLWVPVIAITAIFSIFVVLGALGPSIAVQTGAELDRSDLNLLRAEGVIEQNERVILFYSGGLYSIREDGNVLTDKRVISYEESDGEILVYDAPLTEIESISIEEKGDFFSDSLLLVDLQDKTYFYIRVSTEDDGDNRFLKEVKSRTRQ